MRRLVSPSMLLLQRYNLWNCSCNFRKLRGWSLTYSLLHKVKNQGIWSTPRVPHYSFCATKLKCVSRVGAQLAVEVHWGPGVLGNLSLRDDRGKSDRPATLEFTQTVFSEPFLSTARWIKGSFINPFPGRLMAELLLPPIWVSLGYKWNMNFCGFFPQKWVTSM